MEESQIIDIIIYVLAAGLTVSIFRYWIANHTPLKTIKRTMLWIVVASVVLTAVIIAIGTGGQQLPFGDMDVMLPLLHKAVSLPYFSFFYFMLVMGVVYILRERRRKKAGISTADNKKIRKKK